MSLTTGEMSAADLAAVVGNNRNGDGFGFGGDNAWWIILLFLVLFNGNNGWGGNGNGGAGGLYPWMNQADLTNSGFRDQMLNNNISAIQAGVNGLQTQLCNCCGDMQMAVANGFANAETAANARQMANMNQAFAAQTAMAQGFNNLQAQFADCCCENRLANCQTQNIIQNEGNATRFADANNTRDVLNAISGGIQIIKDQICADKIDAKNDTIAQLRQELLFARGQASQDVQTATLRSGQATTANQLVEELRSCPIPSMPVYGQTPIFTCNSGCNGGCGCGCGCNG